MKKGWKKIGLFLLTAAVVCGISLTAQAAASSVIYEGGADKFVFTPGSGYTATDLFDSFKDVMPGDKVTETITIKNNSREHDYVNIYLRAMPHNEEKNPLTYSEAYEQGDGKDQSGTEQGGTDGQRDETAAAMQDFLSQLQMRVYDWETLIYEASPDQLGGLRENVLLGTYRPGESSRLRVELEVPKEMGNAYANRVGEVDWVFVAEEFDDPPPQEYEQRTVRKVWQDDGINRPKSVQVTLMRNGEAFETVELNEGCNWKYTWQNLASGYSWTIVEKEVPKGYEAKYMTVTDTTTITNKKTAVTYEDLQVIKAWRDNGKNRPAAISVTLYSGETAVETVRLSALNKWSHTWKNLPSDGNWTVVETAVPKGYAASYSRHGNTIVITNISALLQTGQLRWPVPVLLGVAALLLIIGLVVKNKRKKDV